MKICFAAWLALAISFSFTSAHADTIVDGTIGSAYGPAVSVQTVQTEFGDEDGINDANGGELDAAYLSVIGDRLFIGITGNVETDSFNKLSLFIDSRAGGENTLSATPNYDGGASSNLGQVTFATGFEADFHLFARAGNDNFEVDFVDRQGGTSSSVLTTAGTSSLGMQLFGTTAGSATGSATAAPVEFALDNSNTAGVAGGTGAADQTAAAAVTTGAEFSIALSDLGAEAGDVINIVAAYSNGDYNFFSNQFLGGLPGGTGNLGGNGLGDFVGNDTSAVALDLSAVTPFSITVPSAVPEPNSLILLGLGGLMMAQRRRR